MQPFEDEADFEGSQLEDEDEDEDIDNESLFAFREDMPDYASHHRRSSTLSRSSTRAHLLRHDSVPSVGSARATKRLSQKTYLVNEDLTMVVAGFETRRIGYLAYLFLCFFTVGIAYLLFRWLPRWYIAVVGSPCPLGDCRWVVIEVRPLYPWKRHLDPHANHCTQEPMGRDGHTRRGNKAIWTAAFHRVWLH